MSLYKGISHLFDSAPLTDPFWSYVVFGFAFLFEGAA